MLIRRHDTQHSSIQHNDTQHSKIEQHTLRIIILDAYAEPRKAGGHLCQVSQVSSLD
jgi:hypothetical protein